MFKMFGTYICWINILNVNNTGTIYVRIMKQTAFWRGKNGGFIPCLKYSVPIFVGINIEKTTLEVSGAVHQL